MIYRKTDNSMQAVTDEQLIRWVADGDASCLGTLFERHHRAVYQYCLQLTRNATLSEDLVQEVFLKLLRKASSYRCEGSFKAWMFNIARNVAFDQLRKSEMRATAETEGDEGQERLIDTSRGKIESDFELDVKPSKPVIQRDERSPGREGVSVRVEQVIVATVNGGGPVIRIKTLNGDLHIRKAGS